MVNYVANTAEEMQPKVNAFQISSGKVFRTGEAKKKEEGKEIVDQCNELFKAHGEGRVGTEAFLFCAVRCPKWVKSHTDDFRSLLKLYEERLDPESVSMWETANRIAERIHEHFKIYDKLLGKRIKLHDKNKQSSVYVSRSLMILQCPWLHKASSDGQTTPRKARFGRKNNEEASTNFSGIILEATKDFLEKGKIPELSKWLDRTNSLKINELMEIAKKWQMRSLELYFEQEALAYLIGKEAPGLDTLTTLLKLSYNNRLLLLQKKVAILLNGSVCKAHLLIEANTQEKCVVFLTKSWDAENDSAILSIIACAHKLVIQCPEVADNFWMIETIGKHTVRDHIKLKCLEEIDLSNSQISGEFEPLTHLVKNGKKLKTMLLGKEQINDTFIQYLNGFLDTEKRELHIVIHGSHSTPSLSQASNFSDVSVIPSGSESDLDTKLLMNYPQTTLVCNDRPALTDEELLKMVLEKDNLETISLSGCTQLSDKGISTLLDQHSQTLTYIDVNGTQFSASMINKTYPKVHTLLVKGCSNVGEASVPCITIAFNASLQEIDVRETQFRWITKKMLSTAFTNRKSTTPTPINYIKESLLDSD